MKEVFKHSEAVKNIPKRKISRTGMAAIIVGGTIFLNGCGVKKAEEINTAYTPIPTPSQTEITPIPSSLETDWQNLSAYERIQKLETKQYPNYREFITMNELVKSTSEFYYSNTDCNMNSQEMTQNISFVDSDQFIQKYEEELGRSLNTEETNVVKHQLDLENKSGQIFINTQALSENIQEFNKKNQDFVKSLKDHDLFTVFTKSLLFREFTLINRSKENIQFGNITVSTQKKGDISFTDLSRFTFFNRTDDKKVDSNNGANLALRETIATLVGRDSGFYIPSNTVFANATSMIENLNSRAKITRSEFLKYYFGKNTSAREMLLRWGLAVNPKSKSSIAGYQILAAIGLFANGDMTEDETKAKIETY